MAVASHMLELGTPAPPFSLPQPADGSIVALDDVDGAPATLVMFICNHCPYVQHLAATLADVTATMIDRGVSVFAVASNDAEAYPADGPVEIAAEVARRGYRFPYLYDASQAVARAYRAACTPDFFLFDADRRLAYRGQFDASRPKNDVPPTGADLVAAVDAVLAGTTPSGEQLPSLGCGIKWRPGNEPA